jgi:hypothetical protein
MRRTEIVREENPTRVAEHKNFETEESPLRSLAAYEIDIEELVLHGFKPTDRYAIAEAVERELASLLARERSPRLSREEGHIERLNAGTFQVAANAPGRVVGAQVAQALYKSVAPAPANSHRGNKAPGKGSGQR